MTTKDKGRPEPGKVYSLTGGPDTPSIHRGDTWAESEAHVCIWCDQLPEMTITQLREHYKKTHPSVTKQ